MRSALLFTLLLSLWALPASAQRKDSSPLIKAPPTVVPCLQVCESDFAYCESQPQATSKICPESRRICIQRCDPAGLSSDTLKSLKRTPEELRYKPLDPQSPLEQCRQDCQDRRAVCLGQNQSVACAQAASACYDRCDTSHAVPTSATPRQMLKPKTP
ncbi:MAG: hypothetical protein V4709_06150 [Pseudomonadota bacterium]